MTQFISEMSTPPPEHIVISGSSKGLEQVSIAALKAGGRKAELLNVPVLLAAPAAGAHITETAHDACFLHMGAAFLTWR